MSKIMLTNLNLSGNELQNAVIQPLAAAPSNPKLGQVYTNSTDHLLYIYNGTAWVAVGAVLSVAGKTGVVTLAKGDVGLGNVDNTSDATKKTNFTGSIADNDTGFVTGDAVYDALAGKLSLSGGTMTGNLAMGGKSVTGLAAPSADTDASTKKYVDDAISGLGAVFNFKGTKTAASELPTTGNKQGDVWLVSADNSEYVWTKSTASGSASDWEKLGVVVDLSGYAPLASPALTGTPTAPTAAAGTNTTQIATTAFVETEISGFYTKPSGGIPASDIASGVIPAAYTSSPEMDGTASAGTSAAFAKGDHVHPTDTSRAPLASPTFTGTPAAPTAAAGTNTTQIATTAFVKTAIDNIAGVVHTASGTIATNETSKAVAFTGTVISAYATMGGDFVICDIAIGTSAVTFTVASAPASAVTCVVAYI